jgi:hypothetical protein
MQGAPEEPAAFVAVDEPPICLEIGVDTDYGRNSCSYDPIDEEFVSIVVPEDVGNDDGMSSHDHCARPCVGSGIDSASSVLSLETNILADPKKGVDEHVDESSSSTLFLTYGLVIGVECADGEANVVERLRPAAQDDGHQEDIQIHGLEQANEVFAQQHQKVHPGVVV